MKSIALSIEERSPQGIAGSIARLITTGDLAPGDRLPTVRELASDLGRANSMNTTVTQLTGPVIVTGNPNTP